MCVCFFSIFVKFLCVCVCGAQSMIHLIVTNGAVKRSESEPFNVISKPKMSRLLRHRGTKIEDMKHYETRGRMRRNAGTQETERNRKKTHKKTTTPTETPEHNVLHMYSCILWTSVGPPTVPPPPLKLGSPAAPPPGLHKSLFLKPHFNKIPPQKKPERWV